MKLSSHFTLEELTHTDVRADNKCPLELMPDLTKSADMMERVRIALSAAKGFDVPIIVTSAYRCEAVNKAVGGQPASDHLKAVAVDFKAPAFGTPFEVAKFLAPRLDVLGIGQCIHEFGRWVHVSQRTPLKPFSRVITISSAGTELGIQAVA